VSQVAEASQAVPFVERRVITPENAFDGRERRQFTNTHDGLSPDAFELATAIDNYKLQHRRRFITFEEMLYVMKQLGYSK
jgi:hypothetical protein